MNYLRNDIKLVIIFVIIGFLIGPKIFAKQKESQVPEKAVTQMITGAPNPAKPNQFANVKLTAKSAYVWDIANQRTLFSKDGDSRRPLASLTKIMTAVVALETNKDGDLVQIKSEDLATEGNNGLQENEKWSLDDLLALTLVTSSNDGAAAIAASVGSSLNPTLASRKSQQEAFISKMNERSKQLGLDSFAFTTPTGLDTGNEPGGIGSAHDVAKLFEYTLRKHSSLLQYTALPELSVSSEQKIVHHVVNTNEIASVTPGIIGGKTGFTDLAGGNLAIVVDTGIQHPVAIVVLGSTREQRFTDVQALLAATKLALRSNE